MEEKINEILQIERQREQLELCRRRMAVTDAEKGKRNSAIAMGVFAAGMVVSYMAMDFSPEEMTQIINHRMGAYSSWEDFKQCLCDIGPSVMTTATGFALSLGKYLKCRKKEKQSNEELNALVMKKVK